MPAPHPIELRRAAVAALESGEDDAEGVAERFGVSRSTLLAWARRQRIHGTLEASPRGGGNFSQVDVGRLMTALDEHRDGTSDELTRAYNAGLPRARRVHRSSILRTLKREGFVFKKNVRGPQSKTDRTSVRSVSASSGG
jgi:transposase